MLDVLKVSGQYFSKYLAQGLVILLGIGALSFGLIPDKETGLTQNTLFVLGGVALILAGVISTLYIAEVINKVIHNVLMYVILPVSVIYFAYVDYKAVKDEIDLIAKFDLIQRETKQRLKDIRDAEVEFRNIHGHFTSDWDSLKNFVANENALIINRKGDVPEKITLEMAKFLGYKEIPEKVISEVEAWKLAQAGMISGFERDTTYEPVMKKIFQSDKYMAKRVSEYPFSVDSLDIMPFSGGKQFKLEAGIINRNNINVAVFEAGQPEPLVLTTGDGRKLKAPLPLIVGSMVDPTTNGNWGE